MRITIIEDEPILLQRLNLILDGEKGFEVVGAFTSAEEALLNLTKSSPDLILIDLKLPGMSAIELITIVREKNPTISFIAFSGCEDRETVISAFRVGVSGYILKGSSSRELIDGINYLQSGGVPISPRISRIIINELCNYHASNNVILTSREREILRYIEEDLSYKEIAEKLDITCHTVHRHIKNSNKKLKAKGRKDAIQKARRIGLL